MRCSAILALGLFVASATAIDCGAGMPGGWSALEDDDVTYVKNATDAIATEYASLVNTTSFLLCPAEPVMSITGCKQVVAGTNYRVHINVTCPDVNGKEVTVVISADLFEGLAGNDMDDDKIDDVEIEAVFVDGVYVGDNLEDLVDDTTDRDDKLEDALDEAEDRLDDRFDDSDDQFDQFDDQFDDQDDQFDDLDDNDNDNDK